MMSRPAILLCSLLVLVNLQGCQTLKEIASFRQLGFAISGVESPRLAGVDLSSIRSSENVSTTDMLRLGSAVARRELPLDVVLVVSAENPQSNTVDARMVGLDWTLLLDDRATVSGYTESDVVIAPGMTAEIPTVISVNLLEFFESGLPDLLDLALAVAGRSGQPRRVKLQATPTVTTVLGPIKYPHPITIVTKEVGR